MMTGRERIGRIFKRQPVDRIGAFEHFWGETLGHWRKSGWLGEDERMDDHFNLDCAVMWSFLMAANLDYKDVVVEEAEETRLVKNGNYATLRWHKLHSSTPEHVAFDVTDRETWESLIRPHLKRSSDYARRINWDGYRSEKAYAAQKGRFFFWGGVNVFECMHPVCGHENMLVGMALDPGWVRDMADTYAELLINLMEELFAKEGLPDGIWFYEDMGFKERPFMSPQMYRELIFPAHKRTVDYCHGRGLPVMMHSCGFVEPLLPHMIEAGIDGLQVIEVKAGMDPLRIKRNFGDRIVLCGGMDARNLVKNDIAAVRRELAEKIPALKQGYGYILHSDHSIPDTCNHDTYKFFLDEGCRLGAY